MSVLIKGLEMPESCVKCRLRGGSYGTLCKVLNEHIDDTRGVSRDKRMDNCPLVPVETPHGRFIDADRMAVEESEAFMSAQLKVKNSLSLMINEATHKKVQMLLADTPSVIEPEKVQDEQAE